MNTYEYAPDARDFGSRNDYELAMAAWEQRQKSLKFLIARTTTFEPSFGQYLHFGDGTVEWDAECSQTTPILSAQVRNGKAAKTAEGKWIAEPGPRTHYQYEHELLGFWVGLHWVDRDSDGKDVYDYAVKTPTGVLFWGDGESNVLHVPPHWREIRVAAEIISWMCLGEDSGATAPSELTPQQYTWIRSINRENAEAEINDWIEVYDRGDEPEVEPEKELSEMMTAVQQERIDELANIYLQRDVLWNQSTLVQEILDQELSSILSVDDIENLYPDPDEMDAAEAAAYISDEMGEDWRPMVCTPVFTGHPQPTVGYMGSDDTLIPAEELEADDLADQDIDALREYIRNNAPTKTVYEWWLVTDWLHGQLRELGEVVASDGNNHWWGRGATGQLVISDGILQQIARKIATSF